MNVAPNARRRLRDLCFAALVPLALVACAQQGGGETSTGGGGDGAAGAGGAGGGHHGQGGHGAGGAPRVPTDGSIPPHPKQLPFSYTRTDKGTPIAPDELASLTDAYLQLLTTTRYFSLLDERVHGFPESDPKGRYWYGTWWSGADVYKQSGAITYHHNDVGGDNNGLRTAPLLEGSCYATLLFHQPAQAHLFRRLVRGFSSWALAMVVPDREPPGDLLSRAAYLENFTDTQRDLSVDYSLDRPGVDNGATEYVHIPDNPSWGDVWIKNKRSKDDVGHMLRAASQIDACADEVDADTAADMKELRMLYGNFTRRVEDDGFRIATYDKNLALEYPPDTLANFVLVANAECTAALSIRLFGRFAPRHDLQCGDGIGPFDTAASNANGQNGEIFRSFHEAAANAALVADEPELAKTLLEGLAKRIDDSLDGFEAGSPPKNMSDMNMTDLIVHAGNAGVPLTSREVRFVHDHLALAAARLSASDAQVSINTRDPSVPDGSYLFEPPSDGVDFKTLGAILGACASQYRNPAARPLLDCDRVRAYTPN